ncbi:MAG: SusC/RagA family TonB-linked outer membrane protein [Dysgonomonas sp.]|nr:SusC/RagA family TonB-linked outer membrane protein [Dysgonomonas sp.]
MKITVFLFFTCVFSMFAGETYSQQLLPPLDMKNVTLNEVFSQIEKETNFVFLFTDDTNTELNKRINIKTADWENIAYIIDLMLKNTNLSYIITDRQVAVYKKENSKKTNSSESATQGNRPSQKSMDITGIVTDDKGEPIPGVTVSLHSNRRMANFTMADGKYLFTGLKPGDRLIFSFIGMQQADILIKEGQTVYNVVMQYTESQLKEVVVETGIFQRDKISFTGATTSYTASEIKAIGNQNLLSNLKILDPSFVMLDNLSMGSDPNTMATVQLRGQGSTSVNAITDEFSSDPNMPLFIVNGVESSISRVNDLDINRIESITILKDAGSTAIYGSKGANGVVVIETIKPKPGEFKVYYSGDFQIQAPDLSVFNMMNASEKLEFERLAGKYKDTHNLGEYQKALDDLYSARLADIQRGVDTYWLNEPVQTGFTHGHSVRVSGGDVNLSVEVGAKYKNQSGVMKESGRETWGGDIGITYRNQKVVISNFLEASGYKGKNSPYGDFSDWINASPYFRKKNENGEIEKFLQYRFGLGSYSSSYSPITENIPNPLYNAKLNHKNEESELYLSNSLSIIYTPIDEVRLKAGLDLNRTHNQIERFTPPEHTKYADKSVYYQGEYYDKELTDLSYRGYLDASYATLLNNLHSFTFLARGQLRQDKGDYLSVEAQGFPLGSKGTPNLAHSYRENSKPGYGIGDRRSVSLITAFNYNYDKRYLFDFTYSLDGATTFGSNELYKSFWSLGLGWNINREAFLKDLKWIDILKLRGSTGISGNQNQGRVFSKNVYQYNLNSNYFGQGLYLTGLANPDLPWQIAKDIGAGIDFRVLDGKYSMTLDFYHSKVDPSIISIPQVPSSGVSSYPMDLGYITKKGVELILVVSPVYNLKDRIIWQVRLTGAYNNEKYGGFGDAVKNLNKELVNSKSMQKIMDGSSPSDIWAVRSYGIDPATGEEIFIKKNGELTLEYNSDDQVIVGNTRPDLLGVIGTSFRYKDFSVQASFSYSFGSDIYNTALFNKVENITASALEKNQDKRALYDRWKQPGDISKYKSIAIYAEPNTPISSRFVQKNNYLRAESISCSYELNNNPWIRKNLGVQFVKITGYLNDIFRLETSKTERGTNYPFARNISLGVNLSF